MASLVSVVTIGVWTRSRRPARGGMPTAMNPDRVKIFFERPISFSLVIFSGDQMTHLEGYLGRCKYQILEKETVEGLPADIYGGLPNPTGPQNSIVFKAAYSVYGYTVLLDPEMVLATDKDELRQFCSAHGARILCAIWERVSETAALVEVTEAGLVREAWYQAGKESQPPRNPPAALTGSRDSTGLLNSLWQLGIPKGVLSSRVKATRYKLQE